MEFYAISYNSGNSEKQILPYMNCDDSKGLRLIVASTLSVALGLSVSALPSAQFYLDTTYREIKSKLQNHFSDARFSMKYMSKIDLPDLIKSMTRINEVKIPEMIKSDYSSSVEDTHGIDRSIQEAVESVECVEYVEPIMLKRHHLEPKVFHSKEVDPAAMNSLQLDSEDKMGSVEKTSSHKVHSDTSKTESSELSIHLVSVTSCHIQGCNALSSILDDSHDKVQDPALSEKETIFQVPFSDENNQEITDDSSSDDHPYPRWIEIVIKDTIDDSDIEREAIPQWIEIIRKSHTSDDHILDHAHSYIVGGNRNESLKESCSLLSKVSEFMARAKSMWESRLDKVLTSEVPLSKLPVSDESMDSKNGEKRQQLPISKRIFKLFDLKKLRTKAHRPHKRVTRVRMSL